MKAESPVVDALTVSHDVAPKRYLRALVAVARSARPGEYAVVHFGSGTFFRTDRLGALAVRALIHGQSDAEAIELVERIEAGVGERARRLIDQLSSTGTMTTVRLFQGGRRWWLRRVAALAIGPVLSALAPLVHLAPTSVLAWMFRILPSSPIAYHVWRSSRLTILDNLQASGYAGQPEARLLEIGRGCAVCAPANRLFLYLSLAITPERLNRLVERLFDRDSADQLAIRLQADGPAIGVFLHGGLYAAVPNALRIRGQEVVRVVVPRTHGINLSELSGPLRDLFGDSSTMTVEVNDPLAMGALVRHLKAGRSVYIGLDRLVFERKAGEIDMLGHRFPRNDGPAWLAVRSGRPLALWTTHSSSTGVAIEASPPLYPDPSLPVDLRVSALSERLYAYAESAIRQHPEAWAAWSYLNAFIESHA